MLSSKFEDETVNALRTRMWTEVYKVGREVRKDGEAVSGMELLMALHQMIEETNHHWIEGKKEWDDILA